MELTNYALLVTMLLGFTLIEMGSVRRCNGKYPMYKCMLQLGFGMMAYWAVGLRVQHGGEIADFVPQHKNLRTLEYQTVLYDFFQMCIATTIAQMGLAGRTTVNGYVILIIAYSGFFAPVLMYQLNETDSILAKVGGYKDQSRAEMHVFGGFASLAGALAIGARAGRFSNHNNAADQYWAPHDYGAVCLGVLLFHVGNSFWYPENKDGLNVPNDDKDRSIVNVALGAASAAAMCMALSYNLTGKNNAVYFARGFLAGTIALSASASNVDTIYCLCIGILSGIYPLLLQRFVERCAIDVPGAVFSVHGISASVGIIGRAIFDEDQGLIVDMEGKTTQASISGNLQQVLLLAGAGLVTGGTTAGFIRLFCKGRMTDEQQEVGMDGQLVGMGMAMIKDDAEEEAKMYAEQEAKEKAKAEAEANRVKAIAEREARKIAAREGADSAAAQAAADVAERAAAEAEEAQAKAAAAADLAENFGKDDAASAAVDDEVSAPSVPTPVSRDSAAMAREDAPPPPPPAVSAEAEEEEAAASAEEVDDAVQPVASVASSSVASTSSSEGSIASSEETASLRSSVGPAE